VIGWLNPSALWVLPLAVLPIVIHLLRTHHARRVQFPSLRFVQPSRAAAVRMRLPSDILLMTLRVAVVVLAVAAIAGPILLTSSRLSAWNARTARAVVVDTSESMGASGDGGAERLAADAAVAELQSADYGQRIAAADLGEGIARASQWLESSPPARREIVIVSDMQRGALRTTDLARVVGEIGIRVVTVGRVPETTRFDGIPLVGANAIPSRGMRVTASQEATSVEMEGRAANSTAGLRLVASDKDQAALAHLLRAVASAGAPAGSAEQPVAVQFTGAVASQIQPARLKAGWMLRTILRLREGLADTATDKGGGDDSVWTIVSRGGNGAPRVRAASSGNELIVEVDGGPDSLAAAAVVRALLLARIDPDPYAEHEVARVDVATMNAVSRPPAPVSREAWRNADSTDARWLWLVVLVMLGVEQWLRDRTVTAGRTEVKRAA
jgi:hypothetical protein